MNKQVYLGIVGTNGSGKSAVCEYLVLEKGFLAFSLSDIVRKQAKLNGLEITRDNLIKTGNELKLKYGDAALAEQIYQEATNKQSSKVIFDSIRNAAEVEYLKQAGCFIIGVDADLDLRYQRIQQRKKDTDFVSFETFKKQDEIEHSGASSGQNISQALSFCEIIINNNKNVTSLYKEVDSVLGKLLS
jgi:dephospho-CoA kinase